MPQKRKRVVSFNIDGIPPSLNHAYGISTKGGRVRRYLQQSAKNWKELVGYTCKENKIKDAECYGVEIIFYFPIRTKLNKMRRKDVDNMLKLTIDSTIDKLVTYEGEKIDDCRLIEVSAIKCDSNEERTEVNYYAMI